MRGTNRSGGGEGERRAYYVTSDLEVRLGGREKRRAKIVNGMEKNKQARCSGTITPTTSQILVFFFSEAPLFSKELYHMLMSIPTYSTINSTTTVYS